MSVPEFKDSEIFPNNIKSWPLSPDREDTSAAREHYANQALQSALKSKPTQAINLSQRETPGLMNFTLLTSGRLVS